MKIYTRTGDKGTTQVYADKPLRVNKDDAVVNSYGDIDELNSQLGLLASIVGNDLRPHLYNIQRNLFQAGFAISANTSLSETDIKQLEDEIDKLSKAMPPQTQFVLPGGCQAAAQSHVCRAVCRRAERAVISLTRDYDVPEVVPAYLNRLSDYLFTLARYINFQAKIKDVTV
jgi:cob(I)alamin adenosyltransferase